MKLAVLAFVFLLAGALAHADVIPSGSHPVSRCVLVTNLDSYPGIYLIGGIVPVGGQAPQLYIINQSECLTKGYKFNSFNVYWAPKSYIDSVGGAQNADKNSESMHLITSEINPYGGYVPDSDPKTNETIEYSLMNASDSYTLQLVSDGVPPLPPNDTIQPQPQPPAPTQPSPLSSFWCWLVGIFGQKC